jgi:hypothetical protein
MDKQHNKPGNEDNADQTAMDERLQTKNKEEDLPGYPHYPSNEDLLNSFNNSGRVDIDIDNLTETGKTTELNYSRDTTLTPDSEVEQPATPAFTDDEQDIDIVPGTEADVTAEDLVLLGPKDKDMDMGEDEDINKRSARALDTTGEDLDVPGSELDDADENIGEEDEENNYYSLGGDANDNLEDPA